MRRTTEFSGQLSQQGLRSLLGAVVLVLQVFMAVAGPQAEARLDLPGTDRAAHVEIQHDDSCAPAHNHFMCVVGRDLSDQIQSAAGLQLQSLAIAPDVAAEPTNGIPIRTDVRPPPARGPPNA